MPDIFENFRRVCLKFFLASGLAWQAALKKTEVKVEFLTDIDMLLMFGKQINEGIFHSIYRYVKIKERTRWK